MAAADVNDADVYDEGFDAPSAPAAGRAGGGGRAGGPSSALARAPPAAPGRKPALHLAGVPGIFVPEAAMNPTIGPAAPAAGAGRDSQ